MKKNESKSEILKTKVTPVYLLAKRGKSDVKDNVVQRVFCLLFKDKNQKRLRTRNRFVNSTSKYIVFSKKTFTSIQLTFPFFYEMMIWVLSPYPFSTIFKTKQNYPSHVLY